MADKTMQELQQQMEDDAVIIDEKEKLRLQLRAKEQDAIDDDGEIVKLIPNTPFSDAIPLGTLLPLNMASEIFTNVSNIALEINLLEYLRRELGYPNKLAVSRSFASEQVDALCLAIKSFEKGNAFILGDMAGIGKGRVCAGVMRYAFMKGMIPVFVTQKPYLFNDIYRDFLDIGGIGSSNKKSSINPIPFILHPEGVIIDPTTGDPIVTKQAIKSIRSPDGSRRHVFVNNTKDWSINEICKGLTEKINDGGDIDLTYSIGGEREKFNCLMFPYSTISQGKATIKRDFLRAISSNALFVFDESHNAASANANSNILKRSLELVENSQSVLFSSATYAKNPNVFQLYVVKTALRNAVPSLETINAALKVGGENVSEYIAGGLCKEGQMIRRERSFGDCMKITEYVGTNRQLDFEGKTTYAPIVGDTQTDFFDEAIGYFKDMRDFTKNEAFGIAALTAVRRKADEETITLISAQEYELYKTRPNRSDEDKEDFIRINRRRYVPIFQVESINRYKATFRSNVFLACKAKFAADKIIECLNTPVSYTNVDGTTHNAPMKPIIAVANTGEAIFNELRLQEGSLVRNDFSEYLRAVYNKLFIIKVTYRKVDANFFKSKSECAAEGIDREEYEYEVEINDEDLGDYALQRAEIQNRLNAYVSDMPFSIIDYLRDRIESTPRASLYFDSTNDDAAKYGSLNTRNYTFVEGTSRSHMLVRVGDMFEYRKNTRPRSTTDLFKRFNNGMNDVMLINVVASTGGSAQSSPKEGIDTRPRNMFIVQFELDINVEVQKRGRINRSGQINFPTYTYIISKIPAEVRQYLMLRKKLRKLDANVSADQTASSKSAEITDPQGNVIHDIYNKYGYDVFMRDFIPDENNLVFSTILEGLRASQRPSGSDATNVIRTTDSGENVVESGEAEQEDANIETFNAFIRELELYPSALQLSFFNQMNQLYELEKTNLEALGQYQEELRPKNYKAVLRQRVVKMINSGESIFSLPLFLTDYYTLDDSVPYTKEKIDRKIVDLCVWDGQKIAPLDFHRRFIDDFRQELNSFRASYAESIDATQRPRRESFETDETYQTALDQFELRKAATITSAINDKNELLDLITFYRIRKQVRRIGRSSTSIEGMFLGFKLKDSNTRFKYSKSNIRFVFAFLSEITTLTATYQEANAIKQFTNESENLIGIDWWERVNTWRPDTDRRIIRRFYTGNILSGIVEAAKNRDSPQTDLNQRIDNFFLSRFYNLDGSVTTAIELVVPAMRADSEILVSSEELSISSGSSLFTRYSKELPVSTGESFPTRDSNRAEVQNLFPTWNVETDRICDRAICLIHRQRESLVGGVSVEQDLMEFRILQSFKRDNKNNVYRALDEDNILYNRLYNEPSLLDRFDGYKTKDSNNVETISYALKRRSRSERETERDRESGTERNKYVTFNVKIRAYTFNISMPQGLAAYEDFLKTLYDTFDISFSFRSVTDSYYNIEVQEEEYVAGQAKTGTTQDAYPDGDYEYRFIRIVPDKIIDGIPKLKGRLNIRPYGGVVLSKPLPPRMLPAYNIQPYNIPNDILVKLMTSALDGSQKADFVRDLERMAETSTDAEVGQYVTRYLRSRAVPINYFFGDAREPDYGKLVKDSIQKIDTQTLIMSDTSVQAKRKIEPMNEANIEDFLLKLMQLI